jgi:hypothetical protein
LIDFLPSKSTAANITSQLGLVARQQLTEEMKNITDCTMLRDATTKKGHHFYTTQIKTSVKTLTLGVKEVSVAKAHTAVPRPEVVVLNILSDTSILQLLFSSVLSISNCKASISSLRSLISFDIMIFYAVYKLSWIFN